MGDTRDAEARFESVDFEAWRARVAEELGDRPIESLGGATPEGIARAPLYVAEHVPRDPGYPGAPPHVRGATPLGNAAGWRLCARYRGLGEGLSARIAADLAGGADAVWIELGAGEEVTGEALAGALGDAPVDTMLAIDGGARGIAAARAAIAAARSRGSAGGIPLWLGVDPLGALAREGAADALDEAAALAARVSESLPRSRAMVASSLPYHDAGGHGVHELAYTLATAVSYLRALGRAGLDVPAAAAQIGFRFAVGRDIFVEIAKLRAARLLWSKVLAACGASGVRGASIHAVASERTLAARDPWVNMLRVTTQVFAAINGGAEVITANAFDEAIGEPDQLGRRIARNTQLVLGRESHLGEVIDPAGGSYYVERMTDELARAAWSLFRGVEARGGMAAELEAGTVAAALDEAWRERAARVARRAEPITGVSEFANLGEELPVRVPRAPVAAGEGGLPRRRDAAMFEALRDASDAAPARPAIYLANLGPIPEHRARSMWAASFFAAGGIEARSDDGAADAETLAARFADSGATVACVCGTDERYPDLGVATVRALRAAGAERVVIAGKASAAAEALAAAGADRFIHIGVDVVATLRWLLGELGVATKEAS